ncbi:uncharacterized protein LOC123618550 [Camelus bactrianus]|uniref:Uncharacterized protein LOC123618550 n=2 Tax=Camelus bactrianus TaxID=9837 RepID=A0AC58NWW6_CAMBA
MWFSRVHLLVQSRKQRGRGLEKKIKETRERRAGAESPAGSGCVRHPGSGGWRRGPSGWSRLCRHRPAPGSRLRAPRRAQAAAGGWLGEGSPSSEASARLFRPKVIRPSSGNLRTLRKGREAVPPLKEEKPVVPSKASQRPTAGSSLAASSAQLRDCAGGAGSRDHACAARARALRDSGEASSPARGWEEGACAADSRETSQRSRLPPRHFRNEEGRGGASPGRRDTAQALCGTRRHSALRWFLICFCHGLCMKNLQKPSLTTPTNIAKLYDWTPRKENAILGR